MTRYWGSEQTVTKTSRRKGGKSTRPSIADGGSVKNYPFLRQFYRHQATISTRVQRGLFFLVLAGLIYAFVFGEGGALRILLLRHERSQLDDRITELTHNKQLLLAEIERLRDDSFYIEKMGRERFGYVKEGETVYKIVPKAD